MPWKYLVATLYWRGVLKSLEEFNFYVDLSCQTPSHLLSRARSEKLSQYLRIQESWVAQAKCEWDWCVARKIHFTVPGDEDYPFLNIDPCPLLMTYIGSPCWKGRTCLSIVGSRSPRKESLVWMEMYLPKLLERGDITIVSGGARGVDQRAHGISLQMSQPTLSLLPSGLGHIYPKSFQPWLPRILDNGGAIMSSFPPHCQIHKYHFYKRNFLIAGISPVVFLVEGKRKSGSLVTANHAVNLGRALCVLPGSPLDGSMFGNLDLLADGATMVRDDKDLYISLSSNDPRFS